MKKIQKSVSILMALLFLSFPSISFAFKVGEKAPAFSAQSTQGPLSLSNYSGKKNIVLALYFAVFTSV